MVVAAPAFSIAVLAGGRGLRMGGQDKGWVHWQGRALIEHMHETLRPLTNDLIISCNRNQTAYAALADQIVCDPSPSFPGPLIGIIECLKAAKQAWLIVLPCDAPLVDAPLLQSLIQNAHSQPVLFKQQGFYQPLFCALPKSCLASLQALYQQGERSPTRALLSLDPFILEADASDKRLANFNDPSFLQESLCSLI